MPKCKAIHATYLPCDKDSLAEQLVCSDHKHRVAKEAARESARTADNKSALMKAADRTSKAYALMTITSTPGTEKEYADAKKDEIALKARVKMDDEKHEKEMMTKTCKDAVAIAIYDVLRSLLLTTTCRAVIRTTNLQCASTPTSSDNLCDLHRTALVHHAFSVGSSLYTPNTLGNFLYRLTDDNNNTLLELAFHNGTRVARITRFGAAALNPAPAGGAVPAAPVAPVVAVAPRRAVPEPILTAPVDVAAHVAKQHLEMSLALGKPITCPICYDPVALDTIIMTHCGHVYCAPCLATVRVRERKCPQCRATI